MVRQDAWCGNLLQSSNALLVTAETLHVGEILLRQAYMEVVQHRMPRRVAATILRQVGRIHKCRRLILSSDDNQTTSGTVPFQLKTGESEVLLASRPDGFQLGLGTGL